MSEKESKTQIVIYEHEKQRIVLNAYIKHETLWANLNEIADLFSTDKSGISRHIKNIFDSKELDRKLTVANFATIQKEGSRKVKRKIKYYNLDLILSVGYRINSKRATQFRQWANSVLKQYILKGFAVNRKLIKHNYKMFKGAVNDIKKLLPKDNAQIDNSGVLEIINSFAYTWLSLDAYDRSLLPKKGCTLKKIDITSNEISKDIFQLKKKLLKNKLASELFASERSTGNLQGIIRSIHQSFGSNEMYPSIEERAANLLYLIIKNHPFIDGNKRVGAFSFLWYLNKANILNTLRINPEVLTTLTILIAESKTEDKERVIGIILQLLKQ